MAFTPKQQIVQAIKKSQNILIVFKDVKMGQDYPAGGDGAASALALAGILIKNNKTVEIASPDFVMPPALAFLPGAQKIKNNLSATPEAVISVDIKQSGIKNFSYRVAGDMLNIYLAPKTGAIDLKNLKTEYGAAPYDLIIAVDTPELKSLGELYAKNKFVFDSAPIINIDHSPQNENFGHINMVDIKCSSASEVVWQILEDSKNMDVDIIDCVLAGIIAKTKNFRHSNINPRTLELASRLIALGGRRNEIVDGFYRTKSVETLKLWGRALARLKQEQKIIWTVLTHADFIHSGAAETALPDVVHELMANSHETDAVIIFYETPSTSPGPNGAIKALLYSDKINIEIKNLHISHSAGRLSYLNLRHTDLLSAEKELIGEIKKII